MVSFLENISNDDVRRVLSAITLRLSPDPGVGSEREKEEQSQDIPEGDVERASREIRKHLGLAKDDTSEQARQKIFAFLADTLLSSTLEDREPIIRDRLADRGILPIRQFSVEFSEQFYDTSRKRGANEQQVSEAVRQPDLLERLFSDWERKHANAEHFLCVKRYGKLSGDNRYSLLVEGSRRKAKHVVSRAWRIYHREVPCEQIERPLDILRAFVDVYGLPIRVAGATWTKFLENEVLNTKRRIRHAKEVLQLLSIDNPKNDSYEAGGFFRQDELNVLHFAYFYAINTSQYNVDLRKHGIRVL